MKYHSLASLPPSLVFLEPPSLAPISLTHHHPLSLSSLTSLVSFCITDLLPSCPGI